MSYTAACCDSSGSTSRLTALGGDGIGTLTGLGGGCGKRDFGGGVGTGNPEIRIGGGGGLLIGRDVYGSSPSRVTLSNWSGGTSCRECVRRVRLRELRRRCLDVPRDRARRRR